MEFKALTKTVKAENATVVMDSGDHLSIAFKDLMGEYQVINVKIQGRVCLIEHEQTQDAMIARRNQTIFVKDSK